MLRTLWAVSLALGGLLVISGCSSPEKPLTVSGKVTFKGEPIAEGEIQFIDDRTGKGGQVAVGMDGGYTIELFPGTYKVVVTPPYIVDESSGIPNPYYKKVKNIPAKYHSTETSGLRAEVAADKTTHTFDLTP